MTMNKDEITRSRKKLGIPDAEGEKKIECQAHDCFKTSSGVCKYCNRSFCNYHMSPLVSTSASYIQSLDRSDYEKYKKYSEDWQRKDGHPCMAYTQWWNENRVKQREESYKQTNRAYDILFGKNKANNNRTQSSSRAYSGHYTNYRPSYGYDKRKPSSVKNIYDVWSIKHALIFAVVLTIITTLPIGLIVMGGFSLNVSLFTSIAFLVDFISIFVIFWIYSKIATKRVNYWTTLSAGIIDSIFLLYIVNFANVKGIYNFIELLLLLFIGNYISFLIGKGVSAGTYNNIRKIAIYSAKVILILFAILILASLSLHISSYLKSGTVSSGNNGNYSIINKSLNAVGQITNSINSLNILPPTINNTWGNEFFQNVSSTRGATYTYCANLSKFAETRFNTMTTNYQISHYGDSQDFNKTWPDGIEYGNLIYEGIAEEVFYPAGYNASNYVSQIINTAPLHWQLLSNKTYTYYGFYIGNGPTYETEGYCSATEIPGPNINIPQWDEQHGCTPIVSNLTYFVIEFMPFCPYGG